MPAAVTEPETESKIGAIGTGEQPPIAGETSMGLLVPQRNDWQSYLGVDVPTHGEPPQDPRGIDEPGRARRDAGCPVSADDEVGIHRPTSIQRDPPIVDR